MIDLHILRGAGAPEKDDPRMPANARKLSGTIIERGDGWRRGRSNTRGKI